MGSCSSKALVAPVDTEDDTCSICYHNTDCTIPLQCGHDIHASCLTKWWASADDNQGLRCPMCRANTYNCYLEICKDRKIPIGYYRHDAENKLPIIVRKKGHEEKTNFVCLPEQDARDLAFLAILRYMERNLKPCPCSHPPVLVAEEMRNPP